MITENADRYTCVEWRVKGPHRVVVRQRQSLALLAYGGFIQSRSTVSLTLKILCAPVELPKRRLPEVRRAAWRLYHQFKLLQAVFGSERYG